MKVPRFFKRKPKGVPAGGQFDHDQKAASGVTLPAPAVPSEPYSYKLNHDDGTPYGPADPFSVHEDEAERARESTVWTASEVAVSAMEVYPEADEIGYTVDAAGQAKDVALLKKGRVVGFLALGEEDGSNINRGKSGQLNRTVFAPLQRTSLGEMAEQGATITDDPDPDAAGSKIVRFRFDDAAAKAAERRRQ